MSDLKEAMAPQELKRKPRMSLPVTDTDGTIRIGGAEKSEAELQWDMNRTEKMMRDNRAEMDKASRQGHPDLRELMGKFSDLAVDGQRETYNEGNEILRNRRLSRDPSHKAHKPFVR